MLSVECAGYYCRLELIDPELKGTDPKVRAAKRPILNTHGRPHATSVHVARRRELFGMLDVDVAQSLGQCAMWDDL